MVRSRGRQSRQEIKGAATIEGAICSQCRQGGVFRSVQAPAREHQITKVGAVKRIASPVSKKFLGSPPVFLYIRDRYGVRGEGAEGRSERGLGPHVIGRPLPSRSPPLPPLLSANMSAPCWRKRLDRSVLHLFPLTIK